MGIDGAGQSGRFTRGGSSQLPRRTSSSHLPPRYPGQTRHKRQPEHQGKLIDSKTSDPHLHRKHLRAEKQDLQEQFTSHKLSALDSSYTQSAIHNATAKLQATVKDIKRQQGKEQQISQIAANNDIQLVDASSVPDPPVTQNPTQAPSPNLFSLDQLNINNSAGAFHFQHKLDPTEDFSATGLDKKRRLVKEAAAHSWKAYEEHAWGMDELQPITQDGKESLGGIGATIVDSLDTLWLMGLKDDFSRAREWVSTSLKCNSSRRISLFETNIRVVGGLIGAFELTEDHMFLDKAVECVNLMLPVFQTSWTGIPNNQVTLKSTGKKPRLHGSLVSLAEYGSFGVEFYALSQRTGNASYAEAAETIYRWLNERFPGQGLLPTRLNRNRGTFTNMKTYTMGAMADSYYEYLLKMWLLKGQKDDMYRSMWESSMDEMMTKLMNVSVGGLLYIGLIQQNTMFMPRLEHLTCYLPGNLALGVVYGAVNGSKADHYMAVAKNLTYSCWQMYERMPVGLAPEMVWFHPTDDLQAGSNANQLRPEVLESFFYMWRFTGDVMYQRWAWQIFLAFEKYSKVESGYAGLEDVMAVPPVHDNVMQSFWLAETLKYLYLLFSSPDVLPLDKWLLSTEAHPINLQLPLQSSLKSVSQHIVPLV
ncbi:MAG: mannosyl-oligosaccharide 1 [Trebouxia sp. A1-2]|nr:MAG: mannosyl-oligosaccharide 1 [Trebouxia sp. A1-2]